MGATAKTIILKGDPKNPEPAEHIIKFPGGSISVCRTQDNQYWAHIEVNTREKADGQLLDDPRALKFGEIEVIRYDTLDGVRVVNEETDHFAVLIKTTEK